MDYFSAKLREHLHLIRLLTSGLIPHQAIIIILKKASPSLLHALAEVCLNIPQKLSSKTGRIAREIASATTGAARRRLLITNWRFLLTHIGEAVRDEEGGTEAQSDKPPSK